ncbi:MAG TPA: COX15/CtaA family protein [Bryobacteraceae bacterium]|nr:COX15/CtaA family protein [Bryobacteraceae bacterium]
MHLITEGSVGLRRFSAVVAVCTLLLVIAGGLVTSNDAALSIPDWPLAYGKLVPPLEGGIRLEFAHRVLAAVVAMLTVALAVWVRRPIAWFAFAAVAAQAVLGGLMVKLLDPKALAIAHACLAQLCFGLVVAVNRSLTAAAQKLNPAAAAVFGAAILGAAVRHEAMGVIPHIAGAAAATLVVLWAAAQAYTRHMEDAALRRPAMLLLGLTMVQIFLGIGAYVGRMANAEAPQPMPMMIWFTVAHVAVGSLVFGTAIAGGMVAA